MDTEKIRKFAYLTVCGFGIAALLFLFFQYVFSLLLPFAVAFLLSYLLRRPAEGIAKRLHISKRFCRMSFSLLSLLLLFAGIGLLLYAVAGEAWRFVSELSESGELSSMLTAILRFPHGMLGSGESAAEWEEKIADTIGAATSSFVSGVLSSMTGAARAIPRVLLFLLVSVVSVLYISWDLDRVINLLKRSLPKAAQGHISAFKNGFLKTLICYLRSYGILMLMTFVLVLAGLIILRAEYAVLLAAIIAVLDLLPVIGVGTVLVPWSVLSFLMGSSARGIGLLVLLCAHEIMRQIAEPRILGKSLGVHPLITLILLYGGYTLFGLGGLLIVPAVGVLIGALLQKENSAEIS
ncbi:MAG: AI-2E family transporter [Clostridia bacterium]|nr:AI-2E family transporter [Clostridia bacterium]